MKKHIARALLSLAYRLDPELKPTVSEWWYSTSTETWTHGQPFHWTA